MFAWRRVFLQKVLLAEDARWADGLFSPWLELVLSGPWCSGMWLIMLSPCEGSWASFCCYFLSLIFALVKRKPNWALHVWSPRKMWLEELISFWVLCKAQKMQPFHPESSHWSHAHAHMHTHTPKGEQLWVSRPFSCCIIMWKWAFEPFPSLLPKMVLTPNMLLFARCGGDEPSINEHFPVRRILQLDLGHISPIESYS